MNLVFMFSLLLLFVSGFVVSLFFSHSGWALSMLAFFTTWITFMLKGRMDIFKGKDTESRLSLDSLRKLRRYTRQAMPILGIVFLAALAATFSQRGVCATDSLPVFATREHYVLVSHSRYTEVSPMRYYLAGVSFLTGWSSIALIVTLEALGRYIQKEIHWREEPPAPSQTSLS